MHYILVYNNHSGNNDNNNKLFAAERDGNYYCYY